MERYVTVEQLRRRKFVVSDRTGNVAILNTVYSRRKAARIDKGTLIVQINGVRAVRINDVRIFFQMPNASGIERHLLEIFIVHRVVEALRRTRDPRKFLQRFFRIDKFKEFFRKIKFYGIIYYIDIDKSE